MSGLARRKESKSRWIWLLVSVVVGCATADGAIVTTVYEFLPEESTVNFWGGRGGPSVICHVEGQFQLTVDHASGTASFDWVRATLGEEIYFKDYSAKPDVRTDDLDTAFQMTEMVSTDVSESAIDFIFEKNIQGFPQSDVRLTLTFLDNSVELYGGFWEPVHGASGYGLDATAVPEPGSLLLFGVGALSSTRQKQSHRRGRLERMAR